MALRAVAPTDARDDASVVRRRALAPTTAPAAQQAVLDSIAKSRSGAMPVRSGSWLCPGRRIAAAVDAGPASPADRRSPTSPRRRRRAAIYLGAPRRRHMPSTSTQKSKSIDPAVALAPPRPSAQIVCPASRSTAGPGSVSLPGRQGIRGIAGPRQSLYLAAPSGSGNESVVRRARCCCFAAARANSWRAQLMPPPA